MKKRWLSLVLAVCMVLTLLPVSTFAAGIVKSGYCGAQGSNITWKLDSNGLLTVTGSGAMKDYESAGDEKSPFKERKDIISVSISDGITHIGNYSFTSCPGLTSVSLPSGLKSIGAHAFALNNQLDSVTIPDGVETIGADAFSTCRSLTSISIPTSMTAIGNSAFYACSSLKSINLPYGIKTLGSHALAFCSSLTAVSIPSSVTQITDNLFWGCSSLTSVSIPNSITSIGKNVFSGCSALQKITIPISVKTIDRSAFYNFTGLTYIELPGSISVINSSTFSGCSGLTGILIPASVTAINDYAFSNCGALGDVYYTGTREQWNSISIGIGNTPLQNATIHYQFPAPTTIYSSLCPVPLPQLEPEDAKMFLGFLYNDGHYNEIDFSQDPYFALLTGDYNGISSASELNRRIEAFSVFVRTVIAAQMNDSEAKTEYTSQKIIEHLEKELDGMKEEDQQIISAYTSKAKAQRKSGLLDLLTSQIAQHTGIVVSNEVLENCETAIGFYDSLVSAPSKAKQYVDRIVAAMNGAIYSNRPNYSSADDSIFQFAMDYNFMAASENSMGSQLLDYAAWITGKDNWTNHRDILDRWAEFVYQLESSSAGHNFQSRTTAPTCYNDGYTVYTCTKCGGAYTGEIQPPTGHRWTERVLRTATCTESGVRQWTCENDASHSYQEEIPATGHSAIAHSAKAAACTQAGNTAYYSCSVCGKLFSDESCSNPITLSDTIIPATGHHGQTQGVKSATCTEPGYTGNQVCKDCGAVLSTGSTIPATGHHGQTQGAKSATCTEAGYTGNQVCTVCGEILEAGSTIPATGHSWSDWVVTTEPTEAAEGAKTSTCTRCGAARTESIPKLDPVETNPFKDVPDGKYYTDAVLWAVAHDPQITNGYSDGTFRPDQVCTRAQVVTFLWRANGCPEPESTVNPFSDVKASDYYYKAVLWASENNITTGRTSTTFDPTGECTRAHVVTFLWRAAGSPNPTSTTNPFKDVPAGKYYAKAVLWALETGVTTGKTANTFNPDDECTRAHVVTFLYRDMA